MPALCAVSKRFSHIAALLLYSPLGPLLLAEPTPGSKCVADHVQGLCISPRFPLSSILTQEWPPLHPSALVASLDPKADATMARNANFLMILVQLRVREPHPSRTSGMHNLRPPPPHSESDREDAGTLRREIYATSTGIPDNAIEALTVPSNTKGIPTHNLASPTPSLRSRTRKRLRTRPWSFSQWTTSRRWRGLDCTTRRWARRGMPVTRSSDILEEDL